MASENESDVDKLLSEAGVTDYGSMTHEEKLKVSNILRVSTSRGSPSSPSEGSVPESKDEDEKSWDINKKENFPDIESDRNFSNHGNTNQMERSKPTKSPYFKNGSPGQASGSSMAKSAQGKPLKNTPNAGVQGRNNGPDSNSPANSNLLEDGVWLEKKPRGKNGPSKKVTTPKSEDEAKTLEPESFEGRDDTDENKEEKSPVIEVIPLAPLVFKDRNTTSLFSDKVFPPLSIPREEWVNQVCQCLFARKVAKIREEARQSSKWILLSERNISVTSLENTIAKASTPQHTKDEASSNVSENVGSPKTRASPENNGDIGTSPGTVREVSPDITILESPPKGEEPPTENAENVAIALPDCLNKSGKIDTPQNSPAGRSNEDNDFEPTKRRGGSRQRARRSRQLNRQHSSTQYDDNSNEAQNQALIEKRDNTENIPNNADFTQPSGCSPSNNDETDDNSPINCPVCTKVFSRAEVDEHAWSCVGTVEGEKHMAGNSDGEGTMDTTETKENYFKENKPSCYEVDDDLAITSERNLKDTAKKEIDDSDFVSGYPKTRASKRSLKFSDEEDIPNKTPRK